MSSHLTRYAVILGLLMSVGTVPNARASELADCVGEIVGVCAGMEAHLETCLSERSAKMTPGCRDQLTNALSVMQSPTGPGVCVSDIQRFCPEITANALSSCIMEKQSQFTAACQSYIQSSGHKSDGSNP